MSKKGAAEEERYFPTARCEEVFAELAIWTSVEDCLAAARCLEGRPIVTDLFDTRLLTPFIDDRLFAAVLTKCFALLIASYRTPPTKLRLAQLIDPSIRDETIAKLTAVRFRPTVTAGEAGAIELVMPGIGQFEQDRFFLIEEEAHVLELLQNPIRCLIDIVSRTWPTAKRSHQTKVDEVRAGRADPTIFHQPYTDGPLFAVVEALVFYIHALSLGTFGSEHQSGLNIGFRSVEVIGRPPIDERLIEAAQDATATMFRSIA